MVKAEFFYKDCHKGTLQLVFLQSESQSTEHSEFLTELSR